MAKIAKIQVAQMCTTVSALEELRLRFEKKEGDSRYAMHTDYLYHVL